jgi:hypothetical protein
MSALINLGIKGKDGKYKQYTISISDTANEYGQNVSMYLAQSKEQRDAKEKRVYLANGNVIWTDGIIVSPPRKDQMTEAENDLSDDLDF